MSAFKVSFACILLGLNLIICQNSAAQTVRSFSSLQGEIDLDLFGDGLTERLGTDVRVIKILKTADPYSIPSKEVSQLRVILEIDNSHEVTCELILFAIVQQAMVTNCLPERPEVRFRGFIDYLDMGL